MLIYAQVNSAFSYFVRLKLTLVIQLLAIRRCPASFCGHPLLLYNGHGIYSHTCSMTILMPMAISIKPPTTPAFEPRREPNSEPR